MNIRSVPEVSLDKCSVFELKRDVPASLKDRGIKSEKSDESCELQPMKNGFLF